MDFESSVTILRPPLDVFAFLRDKDTYSQKKGSPVLVLEKTTDGPPAVGSKYREVIRILPFAHFEIISEITRFAPGECLEEDFRSGAMKGHLAYRFIGVPDGTMCIQRQSFAVAGLLRPFEPLIKAAFARQMRIRLEAIKTILESGWQAG